MERCENLLILEKGFWKSDQVRIHQLANRESLSLYPGDAEAIEKNWQGILAKNPKAFPGPTIRLVGRHHLGETLVLEVLPSDYKEGCFVSFLGVAMVPVTSDGYIALQGPVSSVAATIGGGIRVPGCTPTGTNVFPHIIKEMMEEFNVRVTEDNLAVIGLIEARPPIAMLHHGLVVKVKVSQTREEFQNCQKGAEDRWEGELLFLELTPESVWEAVNRAENYNQQSRLIIAMVAESELDEDFLEHWPRIF